VQSESPSGTVSHRKRKRDNNKRNKRLRFITASILLSIHSLLNESSDANVVNPPSAGPEQGDLASATPLNRIEVQPLDTMVNYPDPELIPEDLTAATPLNRIGVQSLDTMVNCPNPELTPEGLTAATPLNRIEAQPLDTIVNYPDPELAPEDLAATLSRIEVQLLDAIVNYPDPEFTPEDLAVATPLNRIEADAIVNYPDAEPIPADLTATPLSPVEVESGDTMVNYTNASSPRPYDHLREEIREGKVVAPFLCVPHAELP
jgi:hypothetical protein